VTSHRRYDKGIGAGCTNLAENSYNNFCQIRYPSTADAHGNPHTGLKFRPN
jgi:hypothetical protein